MHIVLHLQLWMTIILRFVLGHGLAGTLLFTSLITINERRHKKTALGCYPVQRLYLVIYF